MQRNFRKPRFPFVNKGKFGRFIPVHRSPVFPGETLKSLSCDLKVASLPIKYGMLGATVDVWFYYVPNRLVWGSFPDWRMGDDTVTFPTANNGDERFWRPKNDDPHLPAKGYELIVNTYFRTDEDTEYDYDPSGELAAAPIVDMTGEGRASLEMDDLDETIDVSGGTLSLSELAKARAKLRYDERMEAMDGKYFNYLRNNGVRISDQMADIPEFLGHYRKYLEPSKSVDQSTGFTVQSYVHQAKISLDKRRYFQEDGYIIGIMTLRPKAIIRDSVVPERAWTSGPEYWPSKDQLLEHKKGNWPSTNTFGGTNSDDMVQSVDDFLFHGQHLGRNIASGKYFATFNPATLSDLRFPIALWDDVPIDGTTGNDLVGDHFVVDGVCKTALATPLRHWSVQ